jgi:serine/threonine protein kinase
LPERVSIFLCGDMSERSVDDSLPIDVRQAIDACCDRFEQAWLAGEMPRLRDYVGDLSPSAAPFLLRELIAIEMEYARDASGDRIALADVVARHPEFAGELASSLAKRPALRTAAGEGDAVHASRAGEATVRQTGSRGLHIRCPHCQVGLELLADAPLDDINCSVCGSNFSLTGCDRNAEAAQQPKQVGRFQLTSRIGVGGFGTVWKARDTELDREVAIKIPRKGQLNGAEFELFFREARAAAQLRHRNIVPVHEVGRDGDTIFIVSDLILGESLAAWLKEQNPSTREMTGLLAKVADSLHYAHERGVVHRDFKPSNVMIDQEGEPHLMDFGLAKREAGEVTMTVDGRIMGTPAYMSPEQASGATHWVDRRTDIYSLGIVLFEVLTGELPFRGNIQMQIRERLNADPPDPRRLNQRAPRDLSTICLKCLEREPNRRYGTAQEVAEELRRYLRGEPIAARPISRLERLARWARRNPAPATAALLTMVLAVAGPVTAIVIYSQSSTIVSQLKERNLLLVQQAQKLDEGSGKNRVLSARLEAVLETRPDKLPLAGDVHQFVISNLLDSQYRNLNESLADESLPLSAKARGHLGLAYLFTELNQPEKAQGQFRLATSALETLHRESPENLAWSAGLSDCYAQLATIGKSLTDPAVDSYQTKAIELRRQIARQSGTVENKLALLDTTYAAATPDRESAKEWEQLRSDVQGNWPSDPNEFYELACFLTHRAAALSEGQVQNSKASSE